LKQKANKQGQFIFAHERTTCVNINIINFMKKKLKQGGVK